MDAKNGIRQRRQERIRRILEQNQTMSDAPNKPAGTAVKRLPQMAPPRPDEGVRQPAHPAAPRRDEDGRQPHPAVPRRDEDVRQPHPAAPRWNEDDRYSAHHAAPRRNKDDRHPAHSAGPRWDEDVQQPVSPAAPRWDGGEPDPEQLWKLQANPWEHAGWRLAPQTGRVAGRGEGAGDVPGPDDDGGSFVLRGLFIQTALAGALFIILFVMFRTDLPIAKKGQALVTAALTDQMDFKRAEAWYDRLFAGAPSFIPLFGESDKTQTVGGAAGLAVVTPLPGGSVVKPYAQTLKGIELAGGSAQPVLAAETGRVLLVTDDKEAGRTVTVQHADERVTVYGGLGSVKVAANEWVEAGAPLGELKDVKAGENSLLFFAVKEKGRYVDPADVVPLD